MYMNFLIRALVLRSRITQLSQPAGQATFEYVVVAVGVVLIWLAIERSPDGFGAALFKVLSQYKFLISIPW